MVSEWERFGRLTVIKEIDWVKRHSQWWVDRLVLCRCDCGKITKSHLYCLKNGKSSSCWCLRTENHLLAVTHHWLARNRLYFTRINMIRRCTKERTKWYRNYGGRWISVCEDRKILENFLKDMWWSYIEWLTLERINNDWNYCKENCRRATQKEQCRNRRFTLYYKWKPLQSVCEEMWLNYDMVWSRVKQLWRDIESALTRKKRK